MLRQTVTWRTQLWIAIFAMLLNALAPSISHALVRFDARAAICTSPGGPALKQPASGQSTLPDAMMQDCAYCVVHGGSNMLPPPAPTVLALTAGHALHPLLLYHAPTPLLALSAAAPRGPPVFY